MPIPENYAAGHPRSAATRAVSDELDLSIELTDFSEYTLLIAKADPGQGFVWLASIALLTGIIITFYLPRRRVWARVRSTGETARRLALGSIRRCRARVRSPARRSRGGPPTA